MDAQTRRAEVCFTEIHPMSRCPICNAELSPTSRFCSSCGAALEVSNPTEMETMAMEANAVEGVAIEVRRSASLRSVTTQLLRSGSPQIPVYRFEPGALLASRYRIISRLGKGGMGEVFRADDIMLGQPVALKFLSESATGNLNLLTRFYDEVRIARQITHANVCRVYDIGEIEGQPYLSMEYIDGEDLGSLLAASGVLPPIKPPNLPARCARDSPPPTSRESCIAILSPPTS